MDAIADGIMIDARAEVENSNIIMRAFDHLPLAVIVYDKSGRFYYMNDMFRELYDLGGADNQIESIADILNGGLLTGWEVDSASYLATVLDDLEKKGEHRHQIEVKGRIISIHDVMIDGQLIISTQKDMTAQIKLEREIAYLASHDMMTGLANRVSFEAQLSQSIRVSRQSDERFTVLMADLDRFKHINDTHGHGAGDQVLKEIACRFRASLGHSDFVARLGGDEFIFLCRGNEDRAEVLASRLASAGQQPIRYDGTMLSVGVSVGYAVFPDHGENQEALLRAADHALYQAKAIGNGVFMRYQAPDKVA